MTLTINTETWFKVAAHPVSKGNTWLKYEPDWAKRREDMRRGQVISDGQTDGQTDHHIGCPQSGALINK